MAENKNSFIKSKMNKDLDDRIIPNNEYRDAQNIAVSRSENEDVGALESILGNELVFSNNGLKTIGQYVDERNGFIYYFVTDWSKLGLAPSTSNHRIYRWQPTSGNNTPTILVDGYFLNFSTLAPVYGVSLLEELLFFTDNRNQPRNINVLTASLDVSNTYYKDEESITVCKYFPYEAPSLIDLRSVSSLKPSTMSDAQNLPEITIGAIVFATENLNVARYRNGDLITHAVTRSDWIDANTNETGAWCYYENNLANGVIYQKLYNSWAVRDSRNICPYGYDVVDEADYLNLNTQVGVTGTGSIKSTDNWLNSSSASNNSTGFDSQPSGERIATSDTDDFQEIYTNAKYWIKGGLKYYSILDNNNVPTIETALISPATGYGSLVGGTTYNNATDVATVAVNPAIGTGAIVTITANNGPVTNVVLTSGGAGYNIGDVLTISGGTDDATITVTSIGINESIMGFAVRVIKEVGFKGWQGDPEFIKDKFVRFSYRFKFDDGEYSLIAPFSQDCYIPLQEGRFVNDDEDNALRSTIIDFMQNSINNIILNIELPSLDIVDDYKIEEIDIIYKESDSLTYKILQNVPVNKTFTSNLNDTNIYQYTYESTVPFKTLPTDETTRVFDKVPVRARAQEISGNRIMYGNFVQSYNAPLSLDYAAGSSDKNAQEYEEYPQHSVKQNRNYQVGVILADKWGRQTDVILSSKDNVLVAGGQPTEGSNFFTTYRPVENAGTVLGWLGESLTMRFDDVITVNGDPTGLYAVPVSYQAIASPTTGFSSPFPSFLDYSVQVLNTVANQTVYTFNNISVQDIGVTNIFSLWINQGNGWVLINSTDYGVTDDGDDQSVVTLTASIPASSSYKIRARLLYDNQYKYEILNITDADKIFKVNKKLRGKYQDYVEIKSVSGTTDTVDIRTNHEISDTYIFIGDSIPASNPTTRVESITDLTVSNFVYDINVTGFYSYRIVIKQQEQEYYNVYLPGIIDGYPIQGNTTEIGDTSFCVLTHDNINKVPRELTDVGAQDTQFNSNLNMFGRVTNIAATVSNQQFGPNSTPDIVELIGSIQKVFPDVDYDGDAGSAPAAGKINNNAIFDIDQKPFIAKINTQKSIGILQGDYNTQSAGAEYPDYLDLAVYETAPTVSNLDLFYETSTTGLISDLNYAIQTAGTQIIGLSTFTWLHNEGDCGGAQLTTPFFALTPDGNDVTSTAAFLSVYSFDSNDDVVTSVNRSQEFALQSAGGGAFRIDLAADTIAGVPHAALTGFSYLQKYQFTIEFTQADGTTSTQQFTRTLLNDPPVIELTQAPQPTLADTTIMKWTGYSGLLASGPGVVRGYNGSCAPCNRTVDLEWVIESTRWQDATGAWYGYITGQNPTGTPTTSDIAYYYFIKGQQQQNQSTCTTGSNENFYGLWLERKNPGGLGGTLEGDFLAANLHEVTMKLVDKNGTDASTSLAIQYTPIASSYTGVRANWYTSNITSGNPGYINPALQWQSPPTGAVGMTPGCPTSTSTAALPIWVGEVANWTNQTQYIYAKVVRNGTGQSQFIAVVSGYNTTTTTAFQAPASGTGAPFASFTSPITISDSTSNDSYSILATLQPFNPTQAQINVGVRPGDSGTDPVTSTSYDWSQCCLINMKIEFTTAFCASGVSLTLVSDTVLQSPPPSPELVNPASGSPPFVSSAWFKTNAWPS